MRSGQLAGLTGLSKDTLRHYERVGVLPRPGRSPNGYRLYPAAALHRVRLVRRALSVGFSLSELQRILGERDRGGAPCRQVRALAEVKLGQVEERLRELSELRDHLARTLSAWDRRMASTPEGQPARLLDSLAAEAAPRSRRGLKR